MKPVIMILACLISLVALPVLALAAAAESAPPPEGMNWLGMLWAFANSPLGISLILFLLAAVSAWIFAKKPTWKALVAKYGPQFMRAVKEAEKRIPDGTPSKGLARLDAALKFVLQLEPALAKFATEDLAQAITAVHTAAEANGNLNKTLVLAQGGDLLRPDKPKE